MKKGLLHYDHDTLMAVLKDPPQLFALLSVTTF